MRIGRNTGQCEASMGKEGEELEMVKVCQVTSLWLVCGAGCSHQFSFDCTLFFCFFLWDHFRAAAFLPFWIFHFQFSYSAFPSFTFLSHLTFYHWLENAFSLSFWSLLRYQRVMGVQPTVAVVRSAAWRLVTEELRCTGLLAVQRAPPDEPCTHRPPQEPSRKVSSPAPNNLKYISISHFSYLFFLIYLCKHSSTSNKGVCDHRFSVSCNVEPFSQPGGAQTSSGLWVRWQTAVRVLSLWVHEATIHYWWNCNRKALIDHHQAQVFVIFWGGLFEIKCDVRDVKIIAGVFLCIILFVLAQYERRLEPYDSW